MNRFENLRGRPFYLNDEDIKWLKETFDSMTIDEKLSQLFFMVSYKQDDEFITKITKEIPVGGLMCRPMESSEVRTLVSKIQNKAKIPFLIAANLEVGGVGIVKDGTKVGSPMMVAATSNKRNAYEFGKVCALEAKSVGANYTFAPIVDLDLNFRNPITNTRTFGNDTKRVIEFATEYQKAFHENNMATSIKHFPGDGIDERDQHLVTSINDMSVEEWNNSFGKIYYDLINKDTKTVMVGHISLPSYEKHFDANIKDEEILPASLSKNLINKLLREKLGFNGLIITDATTMAGFNIPYGRDLSVPLAIENGCDMFLFTKNFDEDVKFMKEGYQKGILSNQRLNDAVVKILALKASLKLYKNVENENLNLKDESSLEVARKISNESITIVKEEKGILPLNKNKIKKILVYGIESGENALGYVRESALYEKFGKKLSEEGFEIEYFKPSGVYEGVQSSLLEMKEKYDLLIYVCNLATKSNQTTVRIEWMNPMGVNVPYLMNVIPTIFISTENPYHLLDVPRVKTYINTYGVNPFTIDHLVDKLMGRSEFIGISPIDPFCGKWDTKL